MNRSLTTLAATLALIAPATAETLTIADITATGPDGLVVEIPELVVVDANQDEETIRAYFAEELPAGLGAVGELDAAELRIPTFTVAYDAPAVDGQQQRVTGTYSDLVLHDVEDGVARGGGSIGNFQVTTADGIELAVGPTSVDYLDLARAIALYSPNETAPSEPLSLLYSNLRTEGATVAGEAFACTLAPGGAGELSARPLRYSANQLIEAIAAIDRAEQNSREPPADAITTIMLGYVDILTAFRSSPTVFEGLACGATGDQDDFTLTTGTLRVDGLVPEIYPGFSLDDFDLAKDDGWLRFGNATWKPTDLSGAVAAVRAAEDQLGLEWLSENWRQLVPAMEGFALSAFDMSLPNADDPAGAPIAVSVRAMDLTLGSYVNGIPTDIAASGDGISFAITGEAESELFRAAGIERLDLGYDVAARWIEEEQLISVARAALRAEGLGSLAVGADLGNAVPDLFATNDATALAAVEQLNVRELRLELENDGFLPALLAFGAADEGLTPEVYTRRLAAVAVGLPVAVLGATPEALKVGEALAAFFNGAPRLSLTFTATDEGGLPFADLMAAQENPEVLQGRVSVAAVASGEPVPLVFPEFPRATPGPGTPPPPQEAPPPVPPQAPAETPPALSPPPLPTAPTETEAPA